MVESPDACGHLAQFVACSPIFSPAGAAYSYDWTPNGLPVAESMVELTVSASGDFDDSNEGVVILLNGEQISTVLLYLLPPCTTGSQTVLLSKSQFNAIIESGEFTITLDPYNSAAADCGGNTWVSAELVYQQILPNIECPADLDGDNVVGIGDFLIVLGSWGGPGGDTDGDGTTGILAD